MKKKYAIFGILGVLSALAVIFMHFGGFGTGESILPEEFSKYAQSIEDIDIPENVRIAALGEATHGNREFQELKLEVFKIMVEKYGVRAFALEGDFGGCEKVNRYIRGGEGSAREAAKAIGFQIYRTAEIEGLILYMKEYNKTARPGEELRFYGFDMQRYACNFQFLKERCEKLGVNTEALEKLIEGSERSEECDYRGMIKIVAQVKEELSEKENSRQAVHFADILLQYFELKTAADRDDAGLLRDKFMADNVKWILQQEEQRGHGRIFVTGHNTHIAKYGSMDSMGKLLYTEMGEDYHAIGTDFYKACVNLPAGGDRRITRTFYSHDPLAKTAVLSGFDVCYLNFSAVPKNTRLCNLISDYIYMGNLGEGYSAVMRLIPPSYRMFQPPATLYDGMIFVSNAATTEIDLE